MPFLYAVASSRSVLGWIATPPNGLVASDLPADPTVVVDYAKGASIALTGMAIVFVALVLISLAIAALPRVLTWIDPWLPEPHGGAHGQESAGHPENQVADDDAVIAAIGYVLHTEYQKQARN